MNETKWFKLATRYVKATEMLVRQNRAILEKLEETNKLLRKLDRES